MIQQTTAVRKNAVHPHENDNTQGKIITAATRLFAQKGYDGASTKEICAAAGVNIAAIHYHFESKDGLYRSIIERFATTRLESARRTLQIPQSFEDLRIRLDMFIRETLESIIKQPELVQMIQRDIEMLHSRSEDVFKNTMVKHFETLVEFLEQAKKRKLIAGDVEPFFGARALFSMIFHQAKMDRCGKKYFGFSLADEKYRERWIQQTLRLFLNGVMGS